MQENAVMADKHGPAIGIAIGHPIIRRFTPARDDHVAPFELHGAMAKAVLRPGNLESGIATSKAAEGPPMVDKVQSMRHCAAAPLRIG